MNIVPLLLTTGALGRFGGGAVIVAPTISVVTPITNPPAFDIGIWTGSGAPADTAVGDFIEILIDGTTTITSAALTSQNILDGTVNISAGSLSAGSHTFKARIKRSDGGAGYIYSAWSGTISPTLPAAGPVVSGTTGSPTFTQSGGYDIYKFTANGSITFSAGGDVEMLLVGGGGGGGGASGSQPGGGGGAGSVISTILSVAAESHTINVGAAGTGGVAVSSGTNGGDTYITGSSELERAAGGGGGGKGAGTAGSNGGSGGGGGGNLGAGGTGIVGEGHNGGAGGAWSAAGGGGGASQAGQTPPANNGGYGGAGVSDSITGSAVTYGGGGGGGCYYGTDTPGAGGAGGGGTGAKGDAAVATAGTNGLGGGGGGGARGAPTATGADGGSGVLIIRIPTP